MSSMRREFRASDSTWRDTANDLVGDGIQVFDRTQAGKQVRLVLIHVSAITSLQNNPAFVSAIRSILDGVGATVFVDQQSVNNIKLFDPYLYNALSKNSLMSYFT